MNFGMTVQAGAGVQPVGPIGTRTLEGVEAGKDTPDMPGCVVAGLAKMGHPVGEELPMIAAVNRMAGLAILLNRRMLPEEGPPFVRMACVTEVIHGLTPDHFITEPSVRFMARRTLHFPLPERMVRLFGDLDTKVPVAGDTEVRLGRFKIHFPSGVDGMTAITGDTGRLVFAHVPKGKTPRFAMTGETLRGLDGGIGLRLAENHHIRVHASAFLDMGGSRTVAGIAPFFVCRTLADRLVGMGGFYVAVVTVLMAHLAGFRIPSGLGPPDIRWIHDPTHNDQHG